MVTAYTEINGNIRVFERSVDKDLLQWHFDELDRIVQVVCDHCIGWSLQFDNELPIELLPNSEHFIESGRLHRLIRKDECSDLIVKIYE